jgi:orotidine-5'-phosphate decarboxylase
VTAAAGPKPFGDRVADAVAARQSQLVLGLDPDPARLWPGAADLSDVDPARMPGPTYRAAIAVERHCITVIEALAQQCVAVKLQVACFERLGAPGWAAMVNTGRAAREHGLLVIADGKRGDIDVSAAAYGQAFFGVWATPFGEVADVEADALTVNPLLGADALAPLLTRARQFGGGLFVLVRTSNPGASDVQDLELRDGSTVSDRLATMVGELGAGGEGRSGLSDVGAVVGATVPDRIESLRQRMPAAILLLPGVGPQGGSVEGLAPAFAPGPAGGLVTASRAIVDAHRELGGDPTAMAQRQAARLRETVWALTR